MPLHLLLAHVLHRQELVQTEVYQEVILRQVVLLVVLEHRGVLLQVDILTQHIHHHLLLTQAHVLLKQELVQVVQCQGHIHTLHVL